MGVIYMLPHAKWGRNDHQEDALHFTHNGPQKSETWTENQQIF